MAALTRKVIMESLLKLLDERPLSKISVKDIVEDCGINRNTFYYHFADMPALVEAIVKDEADRIMQGYHGISSLEDCVNAATRLSVEHKRALLHIYNSANRDIYEHYMMEICEYVATSLVDNMAAGVDLDEEDRKAIILGYQCECFGHTVNWLEHDMSEELRLRFLRLCELRLGMAEEMLKRGGSEKR